MAIRNPLSSIMCLIERGDRLYRHFYDLSKYFLPAVVSRSCIQRYRFKVVRKNKEALQLTIFFDKPNQTSTIWNEWLLSNEKFKNEW